MKGVMVNRAALTLGIVTSITAGVSAYVHYLQTVDKEQMHKNVLRDLEEERLERAAKTARGKLEDCDICQMKPETGKV